MLHAERYTVLFAVEFENLDHDLVANIDDFARMPNSAPRHVGDVQQPVNPTQIDERAVIREILDDAFDLLAFLQGTEQFFAFGAVFLFQHSATRDDHVVTTLIEFDHLEFQGRAFQVRGLAQRPDIHQRTRQKRANIVDIDGEPAFDLAVDDPGDDIAAFEGFVEHHPRFGAACLFSGQSGTTPTVIDHFHGNLDLIADGKVVLTILVRKLINRNYAFGFQSCVDDDPVVVDLDDCASDDGARRHLDCLQTFFKQLRKIFSHTQFVQLLVNLTSCRRTHFS